MYTWIATGAGFLILLLVVAAFMWACMKAQRDSYDERQRLARGTAARAGFVAMIAYDVCYAVSLALEFYWCDAVTGVTMGPWLGVTVFVVVAIWKDAYVSLYESAGFLRGTLIFVLLVDGANLVMAVRGSNLIRDGRLTGSCWYILCAATDLAMLIALAVRTARNRREEKEEA